MNERIKWVPVENPYLPEPTTYFTEGDGFNAWIFKSGILPGWFCTVQIGERFFKIREKRGKTRSLENCKRWVKNTVTQEL